MMIMEELQDLDLGSLKILDYVLDSMPQVSYMCVLMTLRIGKGEMKVPSDKADEEKIRVAAFTSVLSKVRKIKFNSLNVQLN